MVDPIFISFYKGRCVLIHNIKITSIDIVHHSLAKEHVYALCLSQMYFCAAQQFCVKKATPQYW